jgi:hypothetical protein
VRLLPFPKLKRRRQMGMDKKENREYKPFMPAMIKRIFRKNE